MGSTPQLLLVALAVMAVAFGVAFAIGKLTHDESSGVRQAEPIEPSFAAPKLPAAPPAAPLPPLEALQGGGPVIEG
jgi:hypothetical protein